MTKILIENMSWLQCHNKNTLTKVRKFLLENQFPFLFQDIINFEFIENLNKFLFQKNIIDKVGDVFLCSPNDYHYLWGSHKPEADRPSSGNRK